MTSEARARDLLERLNLPDDAPEILSNPRYWNVAFCRRYLECCETMRFEHPEAGLRVAEVAPGLPGGGDVCRLAGELFPLFQELKSDRDAYDALKLFYNAALAQALTVEVFETVKVVLEDRSWGRAVS